MQVYQELQHLQGSVIPHALAATYANTLLMEPVNAIVLEFIGVRNAGNIKGYFTGEVKETVRAMYRALWDCKVIHNDVAERNIAVSEQGIPVLIDFGRAVIGASPEQISIESLAVEDMLKNSLSGEVIHVSRTHG